MLVNEIVILHIDMQYKTGAHNNVADALSTLSLSSSDVEMLNDDEAVLNLSLSMLKKMILL